jgi:hypothetical protein
MVRTSAHDARRPRETLPSDDRLSLPMEQTMRFCLAVAAMLLCGPTILSAEDSESAAYKHKESGLQFKLPKGWTCTEKAGRMEIENKEKTISIIGGVIPKESAKQIFADIEAFLEKLDGLDDVDVTDGPSKEKVHGLEQAWYSGTATIKGDNDGAEEEIEWDMTVISGGKAILFLIGLGKIDDNEKAYENFFESIEKIKTENE